MGCCAACTLGCVQIHHWVLYLDMLLAENMMNLFFIMGEFDCDKLYVIVIDMCVIVESVSNA